MIWSWYIEAAWVIPRKKILTFGKKWHKRKGKKKFFTDKKRFWSARKTLNHEKKFWHSRKIIRSIRKKKSTQEKKGPIHVIKFLTCEKKNWSKNARTYENTRPTRLTRALDTPDLADSAIECDDPKLFGYALFELPPIFFMENNINYPRWTVLIL